jgi:hypothetical protein
MGNQSRKPSIGNTNSIGARLPRRADKKYNE